MSSESRHSATCCSFLSFWRRRSSLKCTQRAQKRARCAVLPLRALLCVRRIITRWLTRRNCRAHRSKAERMRHLRQSPRRLQGIMGSDATDAIWRDICC